jgi:hypothetical protein
MTVFKKNNSDTRFHQFNQDLTHENTTHLVQLTAGMAYLLSRACCKSLRRLSPVTTPGGTISVIEVMLFWTVLVVW